MSHHASRLWVCFFDENEGNERHRIELTRTSDSRFEGFAKGEGLGCRYGLRADGPANDGAGHRFDPSKLLLDPFASRIDRPFHYDERLIVSGFDTAGIVPKAIVESPHPEADVLSPGSHGLIYELNVRSYTMLHPAVPASQRGTVAALANPAVIEHLTGLGVGTVELMPLTAWIDERHLPPLQLRNAWGYNPVSFFAPDPRLAPGGIAEIREAVAALHAAGIRVILDVVYNHTGESDALGPLLSLKGLDQALYFRLSNGSLVNDTGCGNTLACDRPDVIDLICESLRHWRRATGIDGFRFDLATSLARRETGFDRNAPLFASIADDPVLQNCTLIAEPWDVGPGGYQLGQFFAPWGEWNDRYRDDVRRFWRGDAGFVGQLATRLAGSSDVFATPGRKPSASINFVAAHDGMTLVDLVSYTAKRNWANGEDNRDGTDENYSWSCGFEGPSESSDVSAARKRDMSALLATLIFSRGTPMLTAGDEFGRTQLGNNNAYAQDNETTWLNWSLRDLGLESLTSKLLACRARHPTLREDAWLSGTGDPPDVVWRAEAAAMTSIDWRDPHRRSLGMELSKETADGRYDHVFLIFNAGAEANFVLPDLIDAGEWTIELSTAPAQLIHGALVVPGRSVTLLQEIPPSSKAASGFDASDDQIRRLAEAHGVAPDWWDLAGCNHRVPMESLRAILGSLGVPVRTSGDVAEARARLTQKRRRHLSPTNIAAAGHPLLRINVPVRNPPSIVRLTLSDGDSSSEFDLPLSSLTRSGRTEVGGDEFDTLVATLPKLPIGTYRVGIDAQSATLLVSPGACYVPALLEDSHKSFGLTSHLYGLVRSGDAGIGDFETLARFGETAGKLGAKLVGINPLHHLFPLDRDRASPYQPSDRRFLDPIYIDIDAALKAYGGENARGLYANVAPQVKAISNLPEVDYQRVWAIKTVMLRAIFEDLMANGLMLPGFAQFEAKASNALLDHALYESICAAAGGPDRLAWTAGLAGREAVAVSTARHEYSVEIRYRIFLQWLADQQLAFAQDRAQNAGCSIGIYRDLAVGCAFDSGEMWSNPESFANGASLGAPPDPFAAEGQVWHLPPPNPQNWLEQGLSHWLDVIQANMRHAGALRIDHVLGFARLFFVPQGASGAEGAYVKMPRDALIAATAIASHQAKCLVIGEDLGTAEEGLTEALVTAGIYSTRVLWFDRDGDHFASPRSHHKTTAACLSTHDLPTFAGWRNGRDIAIDRQLGRIDETDAISRVAARQRERNLLSDACGGDDAVSAHRFLGSSGASLVLAQVEDLVGETETLNVPGTDREWSNWRRRLSVKVEDLPQRQDALQVIQGLEEGRMAP